METNWKMYTGQCKVVNFIIEKCSENVKKQKLLIE